MSIRILLAVVTLLVIVCGYQYSEVRDLRGRLDACTVNSRRIAADTMEGQGAEFARVLAWLHAFYKAPDGLARPNGLWLGDHPDFEGIGYWMFDVYLRNRLKGQTEAEAQSAIEIAIKRSDEWRAKHH
jgi:hypothetical protein